MPGLNWCIVVKLVKAKIRGGEYFCQHDDLSCMHRDWKLSHTGGNPPYLEWVLDESISVYVNSVY